MPWKSCRLLWLSLSVGCAVSSISQSSPLEDSSLLQTRHAAMTKRLSVECVLNVMEQDQDPSLTGACDYHFALCVSGDIVYYIMDESPSDMLLLEPIVPGSTVLFELEEVHRADPAECTMQSLWNNSGSPLYRAISATAVNGLALPEIAKSSTQEMDILMVVVTIANTSNHWDETEIYDQVFQGGASLNDIFSHSSNGQLTVSTSETQVVTVELTSDLAKGWENSTRCQYMEVAREAFEIVRTQHELEPDNYTFREIFISKGGGCTRWSGLAHGGCAHPSQGIPKAGACLAWYNHHGMLIRAHELGHNLGLLHAAGPNTKGVFSEYGDKQSFMGSGFSTPVSFIPSDRYQLGFLREVPGEVVGWAEDSSSPVLLSSQSVELGEGGADAVAIKFPCDECVPQVAARSENVGGFLWVSFRGEESSWADEVIESDYRQKVFVHLARNHVGGSRGAGTELWAILSEGETYDLPYTDFSVKFCEIIGNNSYISITKDYHNCPTPAPMTLAPTTRAPTTAAPTTAAPTTAAPTHSRSYIRRVRALCKNPKTRKFLTKKALKFC